MFNTFPYMSFSQNVGLVGVTGVRSRFVTVAGGVVMLALGLSPKMAALVEAVPQVVLGGAGLVMFGMATATGARILGGIDFRRQPGNQLVVAIAVGFGLIPLVAPTFFRNLPHVLHPLLESGILLASIVAVVLNAFFNGVGSAERAGRGGLGGGGRRARLIRDPEDRFRLSVRQPARRARDADIRLAGQAIGFRMIGRE
ncbi:Permease family protein [Methylobacterium sp. ap11]|nr:Permease family protein [Methylobacterium sp. ap11]